MHPYGRVCFNCFRDSSTLTNPRVAYFLSEKRKVWGRASSAALESRCVHKSGFAKVSGVSNIEYLRYLGYE